jgi:hypothetical protein
MWRTCAHACEAQVWRLESTHIICIITDLCQREPLRRRFVSTPYFAAHSKSQRLVCTNQSVVSPTNQSVVSPTNQSVVSPTNQSVVSPTNHAPATHDKREYTT